MNQCWQVFNYEWLKRIMSYRASFLHCYYGNHKINQVILCVIQMKYCHFIDSTILLFLNGIVQRSSKFRIQHLFIKLNFTLLFQTLEVYEMEKLIYFVILIFILIFNFRLIQITIFVIICVCAKKCKFSTFHYLLILGFMI